MSPQQILTGVMPRPATEFRRGWPIVLVAVLGMMLGVSALPFYTLGVFAKPIIHEFGWTRGQYQGAFIATLLGAATAPLVGSWCDRYGVRRVALFSTAGFALGLAAIGLLTTSWIGSFYAAWLLMALLGQGTGPLAWTRVISDWFSAQRGLALGIALMGSGITALAAPPLVTKLISAVGWRATYVILAAIVLLVAWPIHWLFLKSQPPAPSTATPLEVAANISTPAVVEMLHAPSGMTLAQSVKGYRFWLIAGTFFVFAFGIAGLVTSAVPLLIDRGLSPAQAASYAATIGFTVIGGRVLVGYLTDKLWAPAVACVVLALPALACLGFAYAPLSSMGITIALLLVGLGAGAEFDMLAYLVSRYFGLRHYGKIYGAQYAIFFIGAALAPAAFGTSYDHHKSYAFILTGVALATVAAAAALLSLGRYPPEYAVAKQ